MTSAGARSQAATLFPTGHRWSPTKGNKRERHSREARPEPPAGAETRSEQVRPRRRRRHSVPRRAGFAPEEATLGLLGLLFFYPIRHGCCWRRTSLISVSRQLSVCAPAEQRLAAQHDGRGPSCRAQSRSSGKVPKRLQNTSKTVFYITRRRTSSSYFCPGACDGNMEPFKGASTRNCRRGLPHWTRPVNFSEEASAVALIGPGDDTRAAWMHLCPKPDGSWAGNRPLRCLQEPVAQGGQWGNATQLTAPKNTIYLFLHNKTVYGG